MSPICQDIIKFAELSALGDHRAGMLLARNGMLVTRIRRGGDVKSGTAERIAIRLSEEVNKRELDPAEFQTIAAKVSKAQADD